MEDDYKTFEESSDSLKKRMLDLYEKAPYPASVGEDRPASIPLLIHWINSAVGFDRPALHPESKILVAGCGTGEEAFVLANHFPDATIVGIDFSKRSIAIAREISIAKKISNLTFEVADLTDSKWTGKFDPFDFVLCHGVADYVADTNALMNNLSACMSNHGVLYMNVNTPHHPAKRIKNAMSKLGIPSDLFVDSPEQREILKMVVKLMGNVEGMERLEDASTARLNVDIFAPIANHLSIDEWRRKGEEAGLWFCGSLEALDVLSQIDDVQLEPFYTMDKSKLSLWILHLREKAGMQMLFSPHKPTEPNFEEWTALLKWRPLLGSFVGQLPEMASDPQLPMHLTLRFQGLPDFHIYSTSFDLEVFRRCNGRQTLEEILGVIPEKGNMKTFRASLFRAYHYGLLT